MYGPSFKAYRSIQWGKYLKKKKGLFGREIWFFLQRGSSCLSVYHICAYNTTRLLRMVCDYLQLVTSSKSCDIGQLAGKRKNKSVARRSLVQSHMYNVFVRDLRSNKTNNSINSAKIVMRRIDRNAKYVAISFVLFCFALFVCLFLFCFLFF